MKKIIFLLFPAVLIMLSSCGGGNDDEFTVECTFLKAQMGTNWKYELTDQLGTTSIYTSEAQSVTEIENTEVIVLRNTSNGQDQETYLTCDDGKLIQSAPSAQTTGGQTVENILLTLELDRPIGDRYLALNISQDLSQSGVSLITNNDYFGEVLETGVTRAVNGTTYNDVVKFQLTTFTETIIEGVSQGTIESAITTYYIAPEAGNIYSEIEAFGQVVTTVSLLEYNY